MPARQSPNGAGGASGARNRRDGVWPRQRAADEDPASREFLSGRARRGDELAQSEGMGYPVRGFPGRPDASAPMSTLGSTARMRSAHAPQDAALPRRRQDSAARPLPAPRTDEHPTIVRGRAVGTRIPRRAAATPRRPAPPPGWTDADDAADGGEWQMTDTWSAESGWGDEAERRSTQRSVPALAAYQTIKVPAARPRLNTRALVRTARNPWWLARLVLAIVAIGCSLGLSVAQAGEPSQRYQTFQFGMGSKASLSVTQEVRPLTSLLRPDQYDSAAQFHLYGPAACSPSVLAEVLTAWGVPNATIGHMIDDLGPTYLSPTWGLLNQQGFAVAAAKNHMRADISWHLTYNQILYLTNVLGIPVIVNFRRDYGYYHYFAGGHFLVVTGGDQQGVSIVDSSEYFIKYLPHDVFDGLWQWRGDGTAMTVVIVPEGFQYTLPAS